MTTPAATGRRRPVLNGTGRVWVLNLVLAAAAAAAFFATRAIPGAMGASSPVTFLAVIAMFGAAEIWVVHLQFRRETHTVSLNEIPLTIGLFFLAPREMIAAQLLGAAPALMFHRHQSRLKLAFNLVQLSLCTGVASIVFRWGPLAHASPLGPLAWLAAVSATVAAAVIAGITVSMAIWLTEGGFSLRKLLPGTAFAVAGAAVDTSFALAAVVTVSHDPRAAALLVLPAAALYLAYRAYTSERQKTERIEFLYNSGRTLAGGPDPEEGVVKLLRDALEMFRAEVGQVVVGTGEDGRAARTTVRGGRVVELDRPIDGAGAMTLLEESRASSRGLIVNQGEGSPGATAFLAEAGLRDAIVTTLKADSRAVGTILIGNRLGNVSGFDLEHLNLLETLAAQVGVSVENGRLERVLHHQAFHDSLTGLANRAMLNQRTEAALARPGASVAVLLIDVDEFKVVNDTMGHAVGDQLLVGVAERLSGAVRGSDTAARIGGDEFAVLVEGITSQADAIAAANRAIDSLREPFSLAGQSVRVSASIGIATNLDGMLDPGALMLQADVAMYAAKAAERGSYRVFEASMQDEVAERHALREDLRVALERGELVNYYQPLVSLDGPGVVGAEALVRWSHPGRGLVAPGYFIRIAEESGLIVDLGRWVLRQACAQLKDWQRKFGDGAPQGVSVNLSAVQLRDPGFVDDVVAILKETGLEARCLTLEVTESTFMDDTRTAITRLRELRGLGIRLELDDFGTGFSSLSILRDLPLDGLKIDKSFVDVIHGAEDRPVFLQAIVRLAQALDLEMVGEGIEEQHQADALSAMGCGRGQGYLFSRPLPAAEMERFLERSVSREGAGAGPVVALPGRRRSD